MGSVSLGVALPRWWATAHGLSVGGQVRLRSLPDGTLRIGPERPAPSEGKAVIEVAAGEPSEHLFRDLLGAYLGGAAEFEVHEAGGLDPATHAVVRTFERRTIRPEVVAEDPGTVLLRDVSRSNAVPLPTLVDRMGALVRALQEDAGRAVRAGPAAPPIAWVDRDDEVDRQGWFIERILVRSGAEVSAAPGPLGYFILARSLERIADHAVQIAEAGGQLAEMAPPEGLLRLVEQFHGQARQHLDSVLELLRHRDRPRANELLDLGEALHATYRALGDRLFPPSGPSGVSPTQVALLARLLTSVDRSVAYAQDMAEVALTQSGGRTSGREPPVLVARPGNALRTGALIPSIAPASPGSSRRPIVRRGPRVGGPVYARVS